MVASGIKILLVDDESAALKRLSALTQENFDEKAVIEKTWYADDALTALQKSSLDCVLIDYHLQKKNVLEEVFDDN